MRAAAHRVRGMAAQHHAQRPTCRRPPRAARNGHGDGARPGLAIACGRRSGSPETRRRPRRTRRGRRRACAGAGPRPAACPSAQSVEVEDTVFSQRWDGRQARGIGSARRIRADRDQRGSGRARQGRAQAARLAAQGVPAEAVRHRSMPGRRTRARPVRRPRCGIPALTPWPPGLAVFQMSNPGPSRACARSVRRATRAVGGPSRATAPAPPPAAVHRHLHPAIGEVAHVAAQAQEQRLGTGGGAEPHALHPSGDAEPGRAHHAPPGPGAAESDSSDGPPLLAIAASMSLAVTGPRNCRATAPSGAIR